MTSRDKEKSTFRLESVTVTFCAVYYVHMLLSIVWWSSLSLSLCTKCNGMHFAPVYTRAGLFLSSLLSKSPIQTHQVKCKLTNTTYTHLTSSLGLNLLTQK